MKKFISHVAFLFVFLRLAGPSSAVILPVAGDTSSTTAGKINATTGKATTLSVAAKQQAFVVFDLSNLPVTLAASNIASARLNLYIASLTGTPGDLNVHVVTNAWQENSANVVAPGFSSNVLGTILRSELVAKKFVEVNVTVAVSNWINGDTNYGLAITTTAGTVRLGAKEGLGTGFPALLEIETVASGPVELASLPAVVLTNNETGVSLSGSFYGDGSGLTSLMASNLAGTVADTRLSTNVALLDGTNAFTGTNSFAGVTLATNRNNVISGSFFGDGAGLENLSVAALNGGTNGSAMTFNNVNNVFAGNGAALTNVSASNVGGVTASNLWLLNGNAGTKPGLQFLGTIDTNILELHVNGQRAFALDGAFDSLRPNVIGGSRSNYVNPATYGATISGGYENSITLSNSECEYSTIGGGDFNAIYDASDSTIGGGRQNTIQTNSYFSTIAGGFSNTITSPSVSSTIAGGQENAISPYSGYDFIAGGRSNIVGGHYSFAGGQQAQALFDGSFVWADSSNAPFAASGPDSFNVRAQGGVSFYTGGNGLSVDNQVVSINGAIGTADNTSISTSVNSAIVGGYGNVITSSDYTFIGGGAFNSVGTRSGGASISGGIGNLIGTNSQSTFIGGGDENTISNDSFYSVIGGGNANTIETNTTGSTIAGGSYNLIQSNANAGTISGGYRNSVEADASIIGGGSDNTISNYADHSIIGGGQYNTIGLSATDAVIPGGYQNIASGHYSFAAGQQAQATNNGTFVWADSQNTNFASANDDSFNIRAQGGVYCYVNPGGTAGAQLAPGATSWTALSDRNAKKNFRPVNTIGILDKLAAIPVQQWNYKWEKDNDVPNIGPMAQDFKAAFYPGRNDKGITTLEFDGVELAAIQGLNQKLETESKAKDAKIASLEKQVSDLSARFEALQKMVASIAGKTPQTLAVNDGK